MGHIYVKFKSGDISLQNLTILTENPFLWPRPWALPLNHCVSCGELSGTHQCPGRAHSVLHSALGEHTAQCLCTLGEQTADRQSTLPGPFLTCVVSHCCLIGKYFDLRSSLCNANMPFYKWFHILNWRVSFGRRVSGGSLDVQENPQQTKMAAQPLIGA